MYALRDSAGRRVHSYRTIADHLGVSENTVMRAIKGSAGYQARPEFVPPKDPQVELAAAESLQRILAANPGIVQNAEPDVMDKLAADIAKAREKLQAGDRMIDELKGGKDEQ